MLDIVICTLNEEGYVDKLLLSLERQSYKDFTVFLSDGNSSDKTVEIATQFKQRLPLKILVDTTCGPSRQRNIGGNAGESEGILFLDADVVLPPNFLLTLMKQVKEKDLVNCWISPLSHKQIDKVMFLVYNLLALEVVRYFWPVGMGGCLYTKRKIFEDEGGFDESLTFWEDIDFIKRAILHGAKFTIFRRPKVYLSTRRFEVEGRINYIIQMLKGTIYSMRTGKIPTSLHMSYPMDINYASHINKKKYSQKKLLALLRSYSIYANVFKMLHEVAIDTVPYPLIHQLLSLPLIKDHRKKIEAILHLSRNK